MSDGTATAKLLRWSWGGKIEKDVISAAEAREVVDALCRSYPRGTRTPEIDALIVKFARVEEAAYWDGSTPWMPPRRYGLLRRRDYWRRKANATAGDAQTSEWIDRQETRLVSAGRSDS